MSMLFLSLIQAITLATRLKRIEGNQGRHIQHHPSEIMRELETLTLASGSSAGLRPGEDDPTAGSARVADIQSEDAYEEAAPAHPASFLTGVGHAPTMSTAGSHNACGTGSPKHLRMVMMIASALELLRTCDPCFFFSNYYSEPTSAQFQ